MKYGIGFILLLVLAAYLPVMEGGFIWDDDAYVTENRTLRTAEGLKKIWFEVGAIPQYYPLVHTTFWVEYRLWGLHPAGYHAVNVLLHALGAILLWFLLLRLRVPWAWLAAAIFALHPVHVESVAWITERKNVLSGVFFLSGLLAYLRFALPVEAKAAAPPLNTVSTRPWGFYFLALALYVCALLSKSVTCTLPVVLLLILFWRQNRIRWGDIVALIPMVVIGLLAGLRTAWLEVYQVGAVGPAWEFTFAERCLIAGRALWFYAGKLIWPAELTFIYPRWEIDSGAGWQYGYPLAAVLLLVGFWVGRRRLGKGPFVGAGSFVITLAPALGFINVYPMKFSFVADHFQYLASIPLIAGGVALASRVKHLGPLRKQPAAEVNTSHPVVGTAKLVCAGGILMILGILTWNQGLLYKDAQTLWLDTLRKNPQATLPRHNLGKLYFERGDFEKATEQYQAILRIDPQDSTAMPILTLIEQEVQDRNSYAHYEQKLKGDPSDPEAHYHLGRIKAKRGLIPQAVDHYQNALKVDGRYAKAHVNLGNIFLEQMRFEKAAGHFEQAREIDPKSALAYNGLGMIQAQAGHLEEAVASYRQALHLEPGHAGILSNLGVSLDQLGFLEEAAARYRQALQIDPQNAATHNNLAVVLIQQGNFSQAIGHLKKALEFSPKYKEAYDNLQFARRLRREASRKD